MSYFRIIFEKFFELAQTLKDAFIVNAYFAILLFNYDQENVTDKCVLGMPRDLEGFLSQRGGNEILLVLILVLFLSSSKPVTDLLFIF